MSAEISKRLKFSVNGEYGRVEFICRCLTLISLLSPGDIAKERLGEYIGWAKNLAARERISWGFSPDGVFPYVRRGKVRIVPNGEEYREVGPLDDV